MQPTSTTGQVLQFIKRFLAQALGVAILLSCLYVTVSPIFEGNWNRANGLVFAVAGFIGAAYIYRRLVRHYDGAKWVPIWCCLLTNGIVVVGFLPGFLNLSLPVFPGVKATVLSVERETISSGDTLLQVELKLEAVRGAHRVRSIWYFASLHGGGKMYKAGYIRPNATRPSPCANPGGPGDFQLSGHEPIVCRTTFAIPARLTSGYVEFDNGMVSDRTPTFSF